MAEKGLISKSTLTAIADAIRAKTETSEIMLPGEMAALIEAIETGASMPDWITEIEAVTATVSSNATSISFATAMTAKATGFIVWATTFKAVSEGSAVAVIGKFGSYGTLLRATMNSTSPSPVTTASPSASLSGGKMTIGGTGASNYYFSAGSTYRAVMWR